MSSVAAYIVEMVHVVKVVNIVGSRYSTPQSQTRVWSSGVWEWLSTSIVKNFKAEKNSIAQYSFQTSGSTLLMVRAIYSAGLSI